MLKGPGPILSESSSHKADALLSRAGTVSPKLNFSTILDTHGAIPWSDFMGLVPSMKKFPGKFSTEFKLDGVILSA